MSRYQKRKTNLDFTEARDSEWQWHQLGYMQVCILLQTDNHTSTSPLSFFTDQMPFLPPNQQRQSAEGKKRYKTLNNKTLILQSLGYYFRFCDGMTGIFRSWSMRQNRLASMVARLIRSPGRVVHGVNNPGVAASSHRVNFPRELPGSRDTAAVDAMASRPELDAVVRRVCARPIA